ncbi:MAG: N-acetyl-gamma-glutamyl-phosphate reductase [Chloroflexota bacterium]|nr:N-acetyl-gamma-glutamyl-phosphate reductase [Chloroflexota bacterium]
MPDPVESILSSQPTPTRPIRVGVYGASGYAGQDAVELLAKHPCAEVVFATSSTYAGQSVPFTDLTYVTPESVSLEAVDAVFLALPHGVSANMAAQARDAGVRVIDLSADLRLDTPESYKQWYGHDHPHPEMLATTPYGLPEFYRDRLRGAEVIAAPGCYPTTTLLGLYPLLKADWIAPGAPIIVDAKSGVSGAGREPKPNTHFVEVFGNFSPYSPGRTHRHVGEIEQEIARLNPRAGMLIFTPHLLPVDRGLMSSIYVQLKMDDANILSGMVQSLYETTYADEPLVNVLPAGQQASLRHVVRTNGCAISITPAADKLVHITSVTDNLRKGASGQAVQCFNLMYGFDETMGLL